MTNQDRYDELDNFISTLRYLRDQLYSKDLIDIINAMLYDTDLEQEMEELEKILSREYEDELDERNREYRKMQGF